MKRLLTGENELYFQPLRDLPYFQPLTNYYGLGLTSLDSNTEKIVLVRDVSAAPDSYQHFFITGTTSTESLASAVVNILPYGMWYYNLYECTGSTLSDVVTSTVLERGLIYMRSA